MKRIAAVAALSAAALGAGTSWAHADTIVGSTAPTAYWYQQTGMDCEPSSANVVIGAITGSRMHEATIDAEAQRLGVYIPGWGSYWTMLPTLLAHYGVKSTQGRHSVATLEADLKAGDHVIAQVNGETLWAQEGFATVPGTTPDHALVVDAVDETNGTVWLTDTGRPSGALVSVPMSTFKRAWSASDYSITVTR